MGLDQGRRPEAGSLGRRAASQFVRQVGIGRYAFTSLGIVPLPYRAPGGLSSLCAYAARFAPFLTVGANDRIGPPRSCIWVRECCGKTRQISRRDTSPEVSGRTAYHRTPRERRPYEKDGSSSKLTAFRKRNTYKILRHAAVAAAQDDALLIGRGLQAVWLPTYKITKQRLFGGTAAVFI